MAAMEVSQIYWGTHIMEVSHRGSQNLHRGTTKNGSIWRFSHNPSIDYGYVSNPCSKDVSH